MFLANGLIVRFSGKGLMSQRTAGAAEFLLAVGLGAVSTTTK